MNSRQFKSVLFVLKALPREDFYRRRFIGICVERFRHDRSYIARQIFRHAIRAAKQWPWDNWEMTFYSDDSYRGQLVLPSALEREIKEAEKGPFIEWNAASWKRIERECRKEARQRERLVGQLRKSGIGGNPFPRQWGWWPSLGKYMP